MDIYLYTLILSMCVIAVILTAGYIIECHIDELNKKITRNNEFLDDIEDIANNIYIQVGEVIDEVNQLKKIKQNDDNQGDRKRRPYGYRDD